MAAGRLRRSKWWRSRFAAVTGFLAVAAYVVPILVGASPPPWLHWLLMAGVGPFAVLGTAILPMLDIREQLGEVEQQLARERQQREELVAEQVRSNGAVVSYLMPLAYLKDKVVNAQDEHERQSRKNELIRAHVSSALSGLFPEGTRCCYFELSVDANGNRRLQCDGVYSGRPDPLRCLFAEHEGVAGPYLFKNIIDQQSWDVNGNLSKEQFHEWDEALGFKSGIACAVFSGDKTYGMLTWDAPEIDVLNRTHLDIAKVIAQDLGTMLAVGSC
ncbi:MAG TPA: hypothetical protein VHX38_26085 [Pseudonocardiaceae bacterium]|jgi:hypothetical protein|nr:hypothetical protein [Pseudonocardiaceae bacterium]